jgi:hypothetical protein
LSISENWYELVAALQSTSDRSGVAGGVEWYDSELFDASVGVREAVGFLAAPPPGLHLAEEQ